MLLCMCFFMLMECALFLLLYECNIKGMTHQVLVKYIEEKYVVLCCGSHLDDDNPLKQTIAGSKHKQVYIILIYN